MAYRPCHGAGRIWCCRSHKVRLWGCPPRGIPGDPRVYVGVGARMRLTPQTLFRLPASEPRGYAHASWSLPVPACPLSGPCPSVRTPPRSLSRVRPADVLFTFQERPGIEISALGGGQGAHGRPPRAQANVPPILGDPGWLWGDPCPAPPSWPASSRLSALLCLQGVGPGCVSGVNPKFGALCAMGKVGLRGRQRRVPLRAGQYLC